MRKFLAVLLAFLMLCASYGFADELEAGADMLFVGGVVYTVDDANTIAQALAVRDGMIVYVGDDAGAEAFRGEDTQVIDLEGRFMMPGLIDSHIHSIMPSFFDFSLLGIATLEETIASIQAYVDAHPEKEAYNGFGYLTSLFTGDEADKGPRKERLDEICPDKPLAVMSFDGHAMWGNSRFFETYGITYETESPKGGVIEKDETAKGVWGTLKDAAIALGNPEPYEHETLKAELPSFLAILNSYGYTSIMTLPAFGTMPVPFEAYRALEEEGKLTVRVHGATSIMDFRWAEDIERMIETKAAYESELIKMNTAKFFMDGVVDARTAYLLEPYEDVAGDGMAGWELETLQEVYAKVNEAGFQIHTHAIGDAALRMSLDAMEYARDNAPEGDYRNAITHLQVVNEADLPRLGELGVVAVSQPFWHYKAPDYWDVVEYAAIGERAEHMYPMQSFLNTGAVLTASSDYPVTADPNPFMAIELGVTRNLPGSAEELAAYSLDPITDMDDPTCLLWPEERVSVEDMLRAYTANGAYLLFAEDTTGTLEAGKAADLVILDQNPLEVDPLALHQTQVLQTYVNGVLVYAAETVSAPDAEALRGLDWDDISASVDTLLVSLEYGLTAMATSLEAFGETASEELTAQYERIEAEIEALAEEISEIDVEAWTEAQAEKISGAFDALLADIATFLEEAEAAL